MNDEKLLALQTICMFLPHTQLLARTFGSILAGSSIQSLLGPSKSLKCCILSDSNEDGLISDPLQLVEVLVGGISDSHPVVQLVHEACQDQRQTCGCGVTTLVCMATYWARGVARLLHEGIPAPVVFDILEEALSLCENTLTGLRLPLRTLQHQTAAAPQASATPQTAPSQTTTNLQRTASLQTANSHQTTAALQKEPTLLHFSGQQTWKMTSTASSKPPSASALRRNRVMTYSRHFSTRSSSQPSQKKEEAEIREVTSLNDVRNGDSTHPWIAVIGDKLCSSKPVAKQLAGDVVKIQLAATGEINMRYVLHHATLGKEKESSQVVGGVVMDIHPEMVPIVAKQRGPLRVVVVNGDCTPSHIHLGMQKKTHVASHDLRQLYESSSKISWLQKCSEVLSKLCVGVVVVGGAVSPLLWQHSISSGIVVLKGVAKQQLEGVCQLTMATPLSYLTHCLERHVGRYSVELSAKEWGWSKPSFVVRGERDRHFERCYICTMKTLSPCVGVVATALLCAKTEWLVNVLKQNFLNCLHRFKLAIEDGYLIPGGGVTEAVCVSKLREKLTQINTELIRTNVDSPDLNTPVVKSFAMETSWMNDWSLLSCWSPHVYEVCIDGLMQYITRVIINCSCSGESHMAMAAAEELVKKVLVGGESGVGTLNNPELLDVAKSKMAAWRRAAELLRIVFLTTRVQFWQGTAVR